MIPNSRHIVIDPNQVSDWRGAGIHNLKKSGHEGRVAFYGEPSHSALPRLAAEETKIDFAFIDGWHSFDHTLIDFFYIEKMLKVGGILAMDDVGTRSVRKVCNYILNNRSYRIFKRLRKRGISKRSLQHSLSNLLGASPLFFYDFLKHRTAKWVPYSSCIALIKEAEDKREWNFFHEF